MAIRRQCSAVAPPAGGTNSGGRWGDPAGIGPLPRWKRTKWMTQATRSGSGVQCAEFFQGILTPGKAALMAVHSTSFLHFGHKTAVVPFPPSILPCPAAPLLNPTRAHFEPPTRERCERKIPAAHPIHSPCTPTMRCVSTHQTFNRRQWRISSGCSVVVLTRRSSGISRCTSGRR